MSKQMRRIERLDLTKLTNDQLAELASRPMFPAQWARLEAEMIRRVKAGTADGYWTLEA